MRKVAKHKMLQQAKSMTQQPKYTASQRLNNPTLQIAWSLSLITLLCFAFNAWAENASRIVKWKDEKGVTHYGDKIPPQYVNRENSVINKQGVTVKHNKPVNYQDQALDLAKLEQDKKDKALLGAFTNAEEIDLARNRNIQLDMIALDNLNQDKSNSLKRFTENKKLAEGFTKRKKPVPADLNAALLSNQEEIARIDQRINERKQTIEKTRKRFDEDKKRYLELKGSVTSDATTMQTGSAISPTPIEPALIEKPASNAAGSSIR